MTGWEELLSVCVFRKQEGNPDSQATERLLLITRLLVLVIHSSRQFLHVCRADQNTLVHTLGERRENEGQARRKKRVDRVRMVWWVVGGITVELSVPRVETDEMVDEIHDGM